MFTNIYIKKKSCFPILMLEIPNISWKLKFISLQIQREKQKNIFTFSLP